MCSSRQWDVNDAPGREETKVPGSFWPTNSGSSYNSAGKTGDRLGIPQPGGGCVMASRVQDPCATLARHKGHGNGSNLSTWSMPSLSSIATARTTSVLCAADAVRSAPTSTACLGHHPAASGKAKYAAMTRGRMRKTQGCQEGLASTGSSPTHAKATYRRPVLGRVRQHMSGDLAIRGTQTSFCLQPAPRATVVDGSYSEEQVDPDGGNGGKV